MKQETLFDRFAETVVKTDAQNSELDKWAFSTMKEDVPEDEVAFRAMYIKVIEFKKFDPCHTMSHAILAATMAAGKRHAVVPLQLMDAYLMSLSEEDFAAVIVAMIALMDAVTSDEADAHGVTAQQDVIYWLTYSAAAKRIPFDLLDRLKEYQIEAASFNSDDVEYINNYKEMYALVNDMFMLFAVHDPETFLIDSDVEPNWEYEGFADKANNVEDEDDWAEDFAPSLMDAIKEDEQFDH